MKKYLILRKIDYTDRCEVEEYDSAKAVCEALLAGKIRGEFRICRTCGIQVLDAREDGEMVAAPAQPPQLDFSLTDEGAVKFAPAEAEA